MRIGKPQHEHNVEPLEMPEPLRTPTLEPAPSEEPQPVAPVEVPEEAPVSNGV